MDLWSVQVKYTGRSPLFLRSSFPEKPISLNPGKKWNSLLGIGEGRVFEIRVLKRRVTSSGLPSFVVRAMGKKNHGNSSFSGMLSLAATHLHVIFFFSQFPFLGLLIFGLVLMYFSLFCDEFQLTFSTGVWEV